MPWLHDGPERGWPSKAATLAMAAAAGLPVPRGFVIPCATISTPGRAAGATLLAEGPVIARAALVGEDEVQGSLAGIGLSIGTLTDLDGLAQAVDTIAAHRNLADVRTLAGPPSEHDRIIVQSHVAPRFLLVGALLASGRDYIECHGPEQEEALACGATPVYAGSVTRWSDPAAPAVAQLCAEIRRVHPVGAHGLDVEIVIDERGQPRLVQVRPLVADPTPGWPDFEAELHREGSLPLPAGVLVLDAEHNPAPLSVAHAWVMHRLAHERPGSGEPVVLAGWLYVRKLVRELTEPGPPRSKPRLSAMQAVQALHRRHIPAARSALQQLRQEIAHADAATTAELLERAWAAFLRMIDVYLHELVPARSRHAERIASRTDPLSLRDRSRHLDVLPAAWDVASVTLAELGASKPEIEAAQLPTSEDEAATLLTEWDDHLFALGLAPLRRVYLRAASLLGLGDAVFALDGDELRSALRGESTPSTDVLRARRQRHERRASLKPPHRIEDGLPIPVLPHARMRGIPVGEDFEGPIAQRRSLEHLWHVPPGAHSIVAMPALTAQMAVALKELGVTAVCCEHGGAMSHATLMARELGLTALVGCRGCTDIPEGTLVHIDTRLGRMRVVA